MIILTFLDTIDTYTVFNSLLNRITKNILSGTQFIGTTIENSQFSLSAVQLENIFMLTLSESYISLITIM